MSMFQFAQPMYDPAAVQPMRDELKAVGIKELLTPEAVDQAMEESKTGTMLLIVNSVCGCAAGNARPGVMLALQNKKIPDHLATVFAGQDRPATERAREYLKDVPPSSPFIAVFKEGRPVHVLQRLDIENRTAVEVAENLVAAFNEHCAAEGPSIPREELEKIPIFQGCGSDIPLFGKKDE